TRQTARATEAGSQPQEAASPCRHPADYRFHQSGWKATQTKRSAELATYAGHPWGRSPTVIRLPIIHLAAHEVTRQQRGASRCDPADCAAYDARTLSAASGHLVAYATLVPMPDGQWDCAKENYRRGAVPRGAGLRATGPALTGAPAGVR